MADKLVSIIVPLYNKENSIKSTLKSIVNQSYKNIEIIIVNDGSTDKSKNVINSIKDNRIIIYDKKNGGVSDARNYGIIRSKGDYIFFLDADDIIYKKCIEKFVNATEKFDKSDIIISNYFYVNMNKEKSIASRYHEGYIENPLKEFYEGTISFRTGNMFFCKYVFESLKFDTRISIHEDTKMWIEILKRFECAYISDILHEYQKEYSILSNSSKSIKNEFSFYINLNGKDSYEKRILANNILRSIIRRIFIKDFKGVFVLLLKNILYLPLFFQIYFKRA